MSDYSPCEHGGTRGRCAVCALVEALDTAVTRSAMLVERALRVKLAEANRDAEDASNVRRAMMEDLLTAVPDLRGGDRYVLLANFRELLRRFAQRDAQIAKLREACEAALPAAELAVSEATRAQAEYAESVLAALAAALAASKPGGAA